MKQHCHYCNLGGVDGNLNDHLTTFKSKFNPVVVEYVGEFDLVINKLIYFAFEKFLPSIKRIIKRIRR
jgi:serine/alanine adding enzyme